MKSNMVALFAIFSVFILFGCAGLIGEAETAVSYPSDTSTYDRANAALAPSPAESAMGGAQSGSSGAISKQVIKTGYATIEVPTGTLDAKLAQLKGIIISQGGQIDSMSYSEYSSSKQYDVTIRVKPSVFDSLTETLKPLGTLKSLNTNSQDVTLQYTDLVTRISHLQIQEARLLELYNKSDNISDILQIEQQLTNVQTQLEYNIAQKNYMDSQITLSTMTLTLQESAPVVQADLFAPLSEIVGTFIGALSFGIVLVAGLIGFLIPVAIVLAIVFVIAKKIWEHWKGRKAGKKK